MLPYSDTKPVGAPDFYFAINATFRFIRRQLGDEGLVAYWRELGGNYFAPVTKLWTEGGLAAVAEYWRAFFNAEPSGEVEVTHRANEVEIAVKTCPAIHHLRAGGRTIEPWFCRHCHHVSAAIAAPAGMEVRVRGGNGSCRQTFFLKSESHPAQRMADITLCA